MLDIDIDPAAGLEHLFQMIERKVKGIQIHPCAVRDILIAQQEIDRSAVLWFNQPLNETLYLRH
jgi:hypothetical protein